MKKCCSNIEIIKNYNEILDNINLFNYCINKYMDDFQSINLEDSRILKIEIFNNNQIEILLTISHKLRFGMNNIEYTTSEEILFIHQDKFQELIMK